MCFSATASFAAGGVLSATGAATLSKTKNKREWPFASMPLFFGIQQLVEGVVWTSFGAAALNSAAAYVFLFFSHVFWPVWVPFSVYLLETHKRRKALMLLFFFFGIIVGAYLLWFISTNPIAPSVVNHSISYPTTPPYGWPAFFLYIAATCGSCLVSSHKMVRFFGVLLILSFSISAYFYIETFFSVWCYFAAILSVIVYVFFSIRNKRE